MLDCQIGVTFPRDGLNNDPPAIRDFAQAAEALGFLHISTGDHVVGRPGLEDSGRPVIDPLILLSHIAAVTSAVGLVCGIMVLPQRQTVLVAKQAAGLDVLSGGRLRLHLSVGWNELEYRALNEDFHNRGLRMDEQIPLLRALWTQENLTFEGRWHHIENAGINPLPVQRPIPIWMAGYADAALRRVATLADGWIPQQPPNTGRSSNFDAIEEPLGRLRAHLAAVGRDPSTFGINGSLGLAQGHPDDWRDRLQAWLDRGANQITVSTSRQRLSLNEHLAAMRRFAEAIGLQAPSEPPVHAARDSEGRPEPEPARAKQPGG
jgi:probable F420-dependent oxidoreductase